ncbi:MAG TPA: Crp/Fnr family transcriptional regulator [Candidatus Baltobacteraceae bacterium]|nr:Crp/Fnr family transcriptional regulator [Candidatus Baltobacteraceae bacterium]
MTQSGNAVLNSLPKEEFERLAPYLHRVTMERGQVLFGSEEPLTHLWFPESGAVTRLVHLHNGESVEAGTAGNDGVFGVPITLGRTSALGQCIVQIGGTAMTMSVPDFEEHVRKHNSALLHALYDYAGLAIAALCQLTACHCLHRVEQRLVRCLLTLADHSANGAVKITHDTLAAFLGVHRPSITYALQALASTGVVTSQRRQIEIRDRSALERLACECYANLRGLRFTTPRP